MKNQPVSIPAPQQPSLLQPENLVQALEEVGCIGAYEFDVASGSIHFSDGMFRLFGEEPGAFVPSLALIDSRSNIEDAGRIRQVLEQALATAQPYEYTRRIRKRNGHWAKVESHGKVVTDATGKVVKLLGVVRDVTDRSRVEEQLQTTNQMLQATLDSTTYTFQAFKAVRNEDGTIVDFEWILTNKVWNDQYGQMAGKRLLEHNPGVVETGLFNLFVSVTETGIPVNHEQFYAHEQFNGWYHQTLIKMGDGFLMNTEDITERKKAEQEILRLKDEMARQVSNKYYSLFNAIDEGFLVIELLYNAQNHPHDFRYLEINPAFVRQTGLNHVTGKLVSEVAPGLEPRWIDTYHRVLQTGEPARFENYNVDTKRWYNVFASRIGGNESRKLALVFDDITERKQEEQRREFMMQLSDALRPLSNPAAVQETATRLILQHFGCDRCYYSEIINDEAIIRHDAARAGLPSVTGVYNLQSMPIFAKVVEAGEPFVVDNVSQSLLVDNNLRQLCLQLQVISFVDVPVIKEGRPVGILCIVQSAPRQWTTAETNMAVEVAERIWTAVERARAEAAMRVSEERFRLFVSASSNLLYHMSADWQQMYALTGTNYLEETPEPITNWVDKYIPQAERERVWEAINDCINHKRTFELEHQVILADGSVGWVFSRAVPLLDVEGNIIEWMGAGNDITRRKNAELQLHHLNNRLELEVTERTAEVHKTKELLQATLDSNPEMIQVFKAVRDDNGRIVDFEWTLNNAASIQIYGDVIGKRLTNVTPGTVTEGVVDRFIEVTESGSPQQYDLHYAHEQFNGWYHQSVVKLSDGVATNTINITERKKAEEAIKDYAYFVKSITDMMPDILVVVELPSRNVIFNNCDILSSLGFNADEIVRMTFEERTSLFHPDDLPLVQAFYDRFLTLPDHELNQVEYRLQNKQQRWVRLSVRGQVFRRDAGGNATQALFIAQDITQRRESELALKESRDRLQSVFDTTLIGMSVFAPVFDAENCITDFRVLIVNKKIERSTGRQDMTGQLYSQLFPGIKRMGLFELMVKTYQSGEPGQMEYHYTYDGIDQWYSTMFVKGQDTLVCTNLDITERIQAENERFKNYLLLQQSEQLAQTGSWDFNLRSGLMSWSEGMYRLFNLQHETEVTPEIYMQYATPDCQPIAKSIITKLRTGSSDFEETIKIAVNNAIKIIHLKATLVKNESGQSIRLLGVDMDVTAARHTESRLRHMEAEQQQQIFKVTLNTQEEERRRISESLHNGLGQLLYAAKLSMSMVNAEVAAVNPEQFNISHRYTEQLLLDAINESRRISHELMPTVLAEFGLKAAIQDICEQLQDGVRFRCQVLLYNVKLDNYLELAVFRTVQELMINVIKHASATHATVQVKARNGEVSVTVQDNGKGLTVNNQNKPGIGLSSIRSKAELLKGTVEIWSEPGQGTKIEVRFPYQLFMNVDFKS
ncbi:PAS domain S-box protein [Mucilaginibacter sp. CSA2-8R]|uniref:PAS domain S-box protein n=1 Tax=Mucilaginibacter sp. CSA2-8R TaxID=3141542 RepID=UPI00315CA32D